MTEASPEAIAAKWVALEGMAQRIVDGETRERYLADWRARYDAAFPPWLRSGEIVSLPDWSHVGEISPRERRQARLVSEAWARDCVVDPEDFDTARRFAWDMGRRVAGGLVDDALAGEALLVERLGSQATAKGVLDAFRRGCRDSEAGEGLLAAIVVDLRCAMLPTTPFGLAERFNLRFGQDYRHTTAKGWLKWDGKRWRLLDEEKGVVPSELVDAVWITVRAVQREAQAVAATGLAEGSIPEWMAELEDPKERAKHKVEAAEGKVPLLSLDEDPDGLDGLVMTATTCRLRSLVLARFGRAREDDDSVRKIANLIRRWVTVRIQEFDTDPLTVNCQNGTLRLKRVTDGDGRVRAEAELAPHRRADLLTKIANVPYDPEAECPLYDGTIEWAQPKAEMRRYLHQWGGYSLTGDTGAQIFHVWWGPLAQNGKSTILNAWADCVGDYAAGGKIDTFMEAAHAKGGDAATPALAKLPGVRMLRTGEPPANAKFDESLINQITGEDAVLIRDNFRSFFEVTMQFKLTVACNLPPSIPNATEGIKRRVKVVPFEKTMKGALKPDGTPLRDPEFAKKLPPELPGVFRRLIEGALDWMENGFVEPGDVTQWTEEYKDDNDPLGRFLSYCTVIDPDSRIQASKFHELFIAWARATGGPQKWDMAYLKKKMTGKGFNSKASNGMQWLGLRAIRQVSDFVDNEGRVLDLSGTEAPAGGAVSARANVREGGGQEPYAPLGPPGDQWSGLPDDDFDDDPFAPPSI